MSTQKNRFPPPEGQRPDAALRVGAFTQRVKELLEGSVPVLWIRGEVSNLKQQASGHVYFTLKDAESQASCVLFRSDAQRSAQPMREGQGVLVFAQISVYLPRGSYQLICRQWMADGIGQLQAEFERLRQKLAAEGLFAAERKRPLPAFPQRIAVVTSPTGAALQDFIQILSRRDWRGSLTVIPSRVQGRDAVPELIAGLRLASTLRVDAVVLTRGGGSLEDLWCFNDEGLARAVAASRHPVISAVGHEIDFTLCDFAADVRAETPSAAAELISSLWIASAERLKRLSNRLEACVREGFRNAAQRLRLAERAFRGPSPQNRLEAHYLRLDDLANRLNRPAEEALSGLRRRLMELGQRLSSYNPQRLLPTESERLRELSGRLERHTRQALVSRQDRLKSLGLRLESASLHQVLNRGFAVASDLDGRLLASREALRGVPVIRLQFHDGEVLMQPVPSEIVPPSLIIP